MGLSQSSQNYAKKRKAISVISLNYSGILLSPFEFFSKQDAKMSAIQSSLSNIYKSLLKKNHPDFFENKKENKFKWNLGKIDQKMQQERYSPLYGKTVGINNNKLQTQDEFKQKWVSVFEQNIEQIKQRDPTFKYSEQQKQQSLEFDLLCYKSILTHVYNKDCSTLTSTKDLNTDQYKQFMHLMFDKTFLNEDKKIQKTLNAMIKQRIDIVFAQQANETLIKRLEMFKEYTVYRREGCESIIIVKRQKFHNFYNSKGKYPLSHLPELEKELMWNNDTMIAFVDNLILISGHLSSKKEKNPQQVFQMMQSLKKLHAIYPMCHIIVGCDANSFVPGTLSDYMKQKGLEKKELEQNINMQIYPGNSDTFTTSKQRTYLQPQISKAEQVARVCRDHLIVLKAEDIQIEETRVCTINNRSPTDVQNLPCQEHPYDHYVVKGLITVNVMTHFGKNYDDGK